VLEEFVVEGYVSEKEQIQLIKDWWKKNGSTILITIVLVFGLGFGWRYWHYYKNKQAEQASVLYEQMLSASIAKKTDDFKLFAQHLIKDYASTPYATLASLLSARANIEQNNLSDAQQDLTWVIQHGKNKSFKQIARIRAARLLLDNNKLQQALQLLKHINDKAFMPAILETRGDVFVAQGDKAQALEEYQTALQATPKDSVIRMSLQMKITQLTK
jgi:predicted negative regulator of RcsB-dependent stress response